MPPHALRLCPDLAQCESLAGCESAGVPWHWDEARVGYGEAAVQAALHALRASGASGVLVGWPDPSDRAGRAATLVALEAARRRGGPLSLVLHGPWPEAMTPPCVQETDARPPRRLVATQLDDLWPLLWAALGGQLLRAPAPAGPAVAVIVRSMDRPTLRQSLDSLHWQTCPPAHVLIVNAAGSVHGELPARWADLPVQAVADPSGRPMPRPVAAQAGLQAAMAGPADAVLYLDDDDLLLPDHLAKLADALHRHPEVMAAFSDVDLGRPGPQGWVSEHRFEAGFDPLRLHFENYLPLHAVLFRRELADRGARFDETLPLFEDWDFWLQCAALGPFLRVPGVSARYTSASAGSSRVFDDSPQARAARHTLFGKWLQRLDAAQFGALMRRLQQAYRAERQQQAQLSVRERELADAAAEIGALRDILAQREREVANGLAHATDLQAILAARDAEILALQGELQATQAVLRDAQHLIQNEEPLSALRRTLRNKFHGPR